MTTGAATLIVKDPYPQARSTGLGEPDLKAALPGSIPALDLFGYEFIKTGVGIGKIPIPVIIDPDFTGYSIETGIALYSEIIADPLLQNS